MQSIDGDLLTMTDADPFDKAVHKRVVDWEVKGEKEMGKTMGCSPVDLDARASSTRAGETIIGNWITDQIKVDVDVAAFNGGGIRGNRVFEKGDLTQATVTAMHPFGNTIVKIYVTGKELRDWIESSLSGYDHLDGSFPILSGLDYTFSASAKKGERLKKLAWPNSTDVRDEDYMTMALSNFMLATSPMRGNKLYEMTTINDAVPLVDYLFEAVRKAGKKCIHPKLDGRIIKLA